MNKIFTLITFCLLSITLSGQDLDNTILPPVLSYDQVYLPQNPKAQHNSSRSSMAAPINDNCSSAILLVVNGGDYVYSNVNATSAGTDPAPATWTSCTGGPSNNLKTTVWFKFTTTSTKDIAVSSEGSGTNTDVNRADYAVYSGTCGSFTQIGSSASGTYGNYNSKRIELNGLAAGTYYIMTDGICSNTGTYSIRVDERVSVSNGLWYPVSNFPTLTLAVPLTSFGQWGTYAADAEPNSSCVSGLQYSDWYKFTFDSTLEDGIYVTDQSAQAGFVMVLYNSAGTEVICNSYSSASKNASFTWDESAHNSVPAHMGNMILREAGLTQGATYYLRISNSAATRYNVNDATDFYTITLGKLAPLADSKISNVTNSLNSPTALSWLTSQTNRKAGHANANEPEAGSSGDYVENSLLYKFNSGNYTSIDINLQNITYFSYASTSNIGELWVQTLGTGGTLITKTTFSAATLKYNVSGLTKFTDYWIVIDGGGSYAGTRLTFDLALNFVTTLPISLLKFQGEAVSNGNLISWSTAIEENSSQFIVEKSIENGIWKEIGGLPGAGISSSRKDYNLIDREIHSGTSYYRLKALDKDGKYNYSPIISVTHIIKQQMFPNPAQPGEKITIVNPEPGNYELRISNDLGKVVSERTVQIKDDGQVELEESLEPGKYIVSMVKQGTRQAVNQKLYIY